MSVSCRPSAKNSTAHSLLPSTSGKRRGRIEKAIRHGSDARGDPVDCEVYGDTVWILTIVHTKCQWPPLRQD